MADPGKTSPKELLFIQLVSMFQVAAMQQMGKILDPASGEPGRDLDQAKISIDILDLLKEKTVGNLSKHEEDFLDKVLFELHMNYVEEKKAQKASDSAGSDKGGDGEDEAENGETPRDKGEQTE